MADQYIDLPIVVDESSIYNTAIATIQETFPDWVPAPGSLIDIFLRIGASMAAVGAGVASDVPMSVFMAAGPLFRILPIDPQPATADSTWTVQDANGYTIPAGTPAGLTSGGQGDPVGFTVLTDAVIPAGQTTAAVSLVAEETGTAGNNLDTVIRADSLGFVTGVVINGVSGGGEDGEDGDTYATRLSQELETLSTTPILGRDFAIIARQIAGVWRAAAIDNYNPADGTSNNEKMVALAAVDVDGNGVSSVVKDAIKTLLEGMREVNFILNVTDPTYTLIDVTYTAQALPGFDPATLQGEANTALQNYLSPATWGMGPPGQGDRPVWINSTVVRINKIIQVIEDVAGIDWAEPVDISIDGQPAAVADINLAGAFPLPRVGTITGTVDPA